MRYTIFFVLILATIFPAIAQENIRVRGTVETKDEKGARVPIIGANVFWLGTTSGTTTDTEGRFSLPPHSSSRRLAASFVGYVTDTILISNQREITFLLRNGTVELGGIEVTAHQLSTYVDFINTQNTLVMTEHELTKAACCNLAESFETNPSIDATFTDAITGTRQLEMLGLAGVYSQITTENIPAIRGLNSTAGLTHIPGTWIESIQVSKGVGSVVNGYESITGQINVELRKPQNADEKLLFVNLFGNLDSRFEGNLNIRTPINEEWSSMTLLHYSTQRHGADLNGDRFLDMPVGSTLNLLQRAYFENQDGWESQMTIQLVKDGKIGGTLRGHTMDRYELANEPREYGFSLNQRQLRVTGKTGYLFHDSTGESIGFQWSFMDYEQEAYFGQRDYLGSQKNGYLNLIYQTQDETGDHRIRLGGSFLVDRYDERYNGNSYIRTEQAPGAFLEYTFAAHTTLSMTAGLRADVHSLFGTFVTPRFHVRYTPSEDWVFRGVAGIGRRSANIFSEFLSALASQRDVVIESSRQGYPFRQESAWNVGLNMTRYFTWEYRDATFGLDAYHTEFFDQVVADMDRNPQKIYFGDLSGRSYSTSFQAELNMQPVGGLDMRIAYRYLDVRQTINGVLRDKPFTAKHRAFINFGYATERETNSSGQMLYDLTVQWFGRKRLPDTELNPIAYRAPSSSPDFYLVNGQVTRSFFTGLDFYLGVENLFDFRQKDPIIDAGNPNGQYFDSSIIWAPVSGRKLYAGLRWRI